MNDTELEASLSQLKVYAHQWDLADAARQHAHSPQDYFLFKATCDRLNRLYCALYDQLLEAGCRITWNGIEARYEAVRSIRREL